MTWTGPFRTEALRAHADPFIERDLSRRDGAWASIGAWIVVALVGVGLAAACLLPIDALGGATLAQRLAEAP